MGGRRSGCRRHSRWTSSRYASSCRSGPHRWWSISVDGRPGVTQGVCGRCSSPPPPRVSSALCPRRCRSGHRQRADGPWRRVPRGHRTLSGEIAAATAQALFSSPAVLRLPPAAPRLAVVEAVVAEHGRPRRRRAGPGRVEGGRADPRESARTGWSCRGAAARGLVTGRIGRKDRRRGAFRGALTGRPPPGTGRARRARRLLPGRARSHLGGDRARERASPPRGRPVLVREPLPDPRVACGPAPRDLVARGRAFRVGACRGDRCSGRRSPCGRLSLPIGDLDPGRSRRRAGPARPGGAEPERPCPPSGLRALQELAPLCQLRGGSRSARTPGAGRARQSYSAPGARARARRCAPLAGRPGPGSSGPASPGPVTTSRRSPAWTSSRSAGRAAGPTSAGEMRRCW